MRRLLDGAGWSRSRPRRSSLNGESVRYYAPMDAELTRGCKRQGRRPRRGLAHPRRNSSRRGRRGPSCSRKAKDGDARPTGEAFSTLGVRNGSPLATDSRTLPPPRAGARNRLGVARRPKGRHTALPRRLGFLWLVPALLEAERLQAGKAQFRGTGPNQRTGRIQRFTAARVAAYAAAAGRAPCEGPAAAGLQRASINAAGRVNGPLTNAKGHRPVRCQRTMERLTAENRVAG